MSFSVMSIKEIKGSVEEAKSQLEEIPSLEGGQRTDLQDYIAAAEAELARRELRNSAIAETLKAL